MNPERQNDGKSERVLKHRTKKRAHTQTRIQASPISKQQQLLLLLLLILLSLLLLFCWFYRKRKYLFLFSFFPLSLRSFVLFFSILTIFFSSSIPSSYIDMPGSTMHKAHIHIKEWRVRAECGRTDGGGMDGRERKRNNVILCVIYSFSLTPSL